MVEKLKDNHKMRRIIGNTLIILGIALIIGIISVNVRDIARSIRAVNEFNLRKGLEITNNDTALSTAEKNDQSAGADTDTQEGVDTDTEDRTSQRNSGGELICLLRIPKISLEEAVREGDSRDVLSSALCHLEKTAYPGKPGNCCISGHRNYVFGKYFNRLNEVSVGDIIELETLDNTYSYQVYETLVVEPNAVEVLDNTDDKTLTLITCTPLFVGTHRLIVKAICVQ